MSGEQPDVGTDLGPLVTPMPSGPGPVPAVVDEPVLRRIGRAERERVEARLRQALVDDVITITEFDERLGEVLAARTQPELDRVVADLPDEEHLSAYDGPALTEQESVVALMSSAEQRGRWRPAKPLRVTATMGSAVVDLREAVTDDGTFTINANVFMGSVEVIVPDNAQVTTTGTAVMGARENTVPAPTGPGPRVQVHVDAVMGGVKIRPATKRERRRQAKTSGDQPLSPVPWSAPTSRQARRGWAGRAITAAVLLALALGPGRAALSADQVSLFGSAVYEANPAQLRGTDDVDVFVMFGSVQVVVPETHRARNEVVPLFGSAECDFACFDAQTATSETETPEPPPTVTVDGLVMFGSAEIIAPGEQLDEGDDD